MIDVALELGVGDRDRIRGYEKISQQEVGEGVPIVRRSGVTTRTSCRVVLDCKRPARELVAYLVVILPVVLEPEPERVLTVNPRQLVDKLKRVIVVFVRSFGAIAETGESCSGKAYGRNSPGD